MSKRKANICALLLAIVWFCVWLFLHTIKVCNGELELGCIFSNAMAIWYMLDRIDDFRQWLMKTNN